MPAFPVIDVVSRALRHFPHESIPDGAVLAPHHAYIGLFAVVLALWVVGDNYREEPTVTAVGALSALFGFLFVWKWYPEVGAAFSVGGALAMLAATLWPSASTVAGVWTVAGGFAKALVTPETVREVWPTGEWSRYQLRWRTTAAIGAAVATDDVLEHALPVGSPLDWIWVQYLYPVVSSL